MIEDQTSQSVELKTLSSNFLFLFKKIDFNSTLDRKMRSTLNWMHENQR